MSEDLGDILFSVGYPLLVAFGLGMMFGVRIVREGLTRRYLNKEKANA